MRLASDYFDDVNARGDFYINPEGTRFCAAIPSPMGRGWAYIQIPIGREKPAQSPSWQWDGNRERPTLSPSIHTHGHWHGWVRNGEMVEA